MAGKPSLQFYPGDWWRANDVKGCSMCTQGVWFNLLMAMWDEPKQGRIKDTKEGICRIIGANLDELDEFFEDNKSHSFANVTFRNKKVTIINRRMYQAYIQREGTKTRVQEHRHKVKRKCNGNVTPYSSTSTSINTKDVTLLLQFEQGRKKYPGTKRGCDTEYENLQKKHKNWREVIHLFLPAIELQAAQWKFEGTPKKYIPHFKTWINNKHWEQTTGQTISLEEKATTEQKALERKRQEIRKDEGDYYREKTTDELMAMLNEKKHLSRRWLIDEILAEKGK